MIFQAALRLDISFFVLLWLGSILLIALNWLGNYNFYTAQGWVTKIIIQIKTSLQSQPEA